MKKYLLVLSLFFSFLGRANENDFLKAVETGNITLVEQMLQNGTDVNSKDEDGNTALMRASQKGDKDMTELLVKKGANIGYLNEKGVTALGLAYQEDHMEIFDFLFSIKIKSLTESSDINAKDEEGYTALMLAALIGKKEMVENFIANGADVNIRNKKGETALILAAYSGKKDIVNLLIEAGADIEAKDMLGYTALIGAFEGFVESKQGFHPVRKSEKYEWEDVIKLLIKKGANVNIKREAEDTLLMAASYFANKELIKLLIENGADVNAKDKYGNTALSLAAEANMSITQEEYLKNKKVKEEIVELLLKNGAKQKPLTQKSP